MWQNYSSNVPFDPVRWEIRSKVSQELSDHPFNNVMREYADWASNMTNHLVGCNQGCGKILYLVQKERAPVTYDRLAAWAFPGVHVDLIWVTRQMWTFIYEHVTPLSNVVSAKRSARLRS